MEKIEVYFEILDNIIVGYHNEEVDVTFLPKNTKILKTQSQSRPELLLGLEEKYLDESSEVVQQMFQQMNKKNQLPVEVSLKSQLKSILENLQLSEKLGEDTTVLQAQFDELAKEYKASKNIPPKVTAGKSKTMYLPKTEIILKGTATDKNGKVVSTNWSKIKGGNAVIKTPETVETKVSNLEEGVYTFRLTAVDNKGDSAVSDITIKVEPKKEEVVFKISPKSKRSIPIQGKEFKVKVTSNNNWIATGPENVVITPNMGVEDDTVTVNVKENTTGGPLLGTIIFASGDTKLNLTWTQEGIYAE